MNPVEQLLNDLLTGVFVNAEGAFDTATLATRIAELSDPELAEFEALAQAAFDSIAAGEQAVEGSIVEISTRVVVAIEACQGEAQVRIETAAAVDAEMAALAERVHAGPEDPEVDPEAEPADPEAEPDPEAAPADPDAVVVEPAVEPELEPVAAAARVNRPHISRIAARRAAPVVAPVVASQARTRITAGAEVQGLTAGAEISRDQLVSAFERRADSLARIPTRSLKAAVGYHVASIEADYPDEQTLGDNGEQNARLIRNMLEPQALAAAGGVCAPAVPIYEQMAIADDARPVRDSLNAFNATRGGVIISPSPVWTDYSAGVSTWTQTMDADAVDDEDVRKPCVRVDCADPVTFRTRAIPVCVTVGNWFQMSFPERLDAILSGVGAWQARYAERALLDDIGDLATPGTAPSIVGSTRTVLFELQKRVAGFRGRHRVPDTFTLEWWAPRWFRNMVHADLALTMPIGNTQEENLAITDQRVDAWFRNLGLNVHWIWEGETGAGQEFVNQNDDWPDRMITYLTHPGALGLLDQGRIDLGVQRSPELNAANDLQIWGETFEGVFYQGLELQRIDFAVCPSGTVSGTDDIASIVCPGS